MHKSGNQSNITKKTLNQHIPTWVKEENEKEPEARYCNSKYCQSFRDQSIARLREIGLPKPFLVSSRLPPLLHNLIKKKKSESRSILPIPIHHYLPSNLIASLLLSTNN